MRPFSYRSEGPYKKDGPMVFSLHGTSAGIGVIRYGKLALLIMIII